MRLGDILKLKQQRPFQPFRMHLSDGASYDVRHPELLMVGRSIVIVGIPAPEDEGVVFDQFVHCALIHITRTEFINGVVRR